MTDYPKPCPTCGASPFIGGSGLARASRPTLTDAEMVAKAWQALKDQVCADPNKAQRVVMVGRPEFERALRTAGLIGYGR